MRIVFLPAASKDTEDAALWYNRQRTGLGLEFLLSVEAAINSIHRNPHHFAIVKKNYRRYTINRFPFGIFYSVEDDLKLYMQSGIIKENPLDGKNDRNP